MINNLAAYRKKAGLRIADVAKALNLSSKTVWKWEQPNYDLKDLKISQLEKLCELFHIKISDLVEL